MNSICVIFDLDGTLVDSETLCNQAFRDLLPQLTETVQALVQANRGRKLASILTGIERTLGEKLPSTFEDQYRARVADLFARDLVAISGVDEMLEKIGADKCVASSGPRHKIQLALEVTGISRHFGDKLFSSYEVGAWKPDPGLFLHAAAAMGYPANRCAVVEDSAVGVQAGLLAGMQVFQFVAHANEIPNPNGISFSDMSLLPGLLARFEVELQPGR